MYSGTTLTKFSGRILGTHQKIDRVARNRLADLLGPNSFFPPIKSILHFEGVNGPDAIKRKSPAKDEPHHFFDPSDESDTKILEVIESHYKRLVLELKNRNQERAAFEAAWLAHALVDGLTPAHHYPYEQKMSELRGGKGFDSRTTIKEKWLMPGFSKREQVKNNWKAWGPKGLMMAHSMFELGVATIIMPLTFSEVEAKPSDIETIRRLGISQWFRRTAQDLEKLNMYENYIEKGWTPKLAWQVRHKLGPTLIEAVIVAWHQAALEAEK